MGVRKETGGVLRAVVQSSEPAVEAVRASRSKTAGVAPEGSA
jgi:hypothetical protein